MSSMQPIQLIGAIVFGSLPAQADMPTLRSDIVTVLDGWFDSYLSNQNDAPGDVRGGQFHKSDNMRMQECTQLIAWSYVNEESRHHRCSRSKRRSRLSGHQY